MTIKQESEVDIDTIVLLQAEYLWVSRCLLGLAATQLHFMIVAFRPLRTRIRD